jgi:hypothetical protein
VETDQRPALIARRAAKDRAPSLGKWSRCSIRPIRPVCAWICYAGVPVQHGWTSTIAGKTVSFVQNRLFLHACPAMAAAIWFNACAIRPDPMKQAYFPNWMKL